MSTPLTDAAARQVHGTRSFRRLGFLLSAPLALLLAAAPAGAQTPPAAGTISSAKMDDAVREMSRSPLMNSLSQQQQMD
jgi:hypothetical protein